MKKIHTATSTTAFTVGQEVTFKCCYGVNRIESIKGQTATLFELNTKMTHTKRLSSLTAYTGYVAPVWGEQEIAHGNAVHKHGATVYSCISGDGNGCRKVWDDVKKDCVNPQDLTVI